MTIQNKIKQIKAVTTKTIVTFKSSSFQLLATFFVLILLSMGSVNGINYYSAGNNAANVTTNWWTGTNGTGSNPTNFTSNGNVFIIQNSHSMTTTGTWTVSGTGSTIQINSGGTLIASNAVTATVMTVAGGGTYQHAFNGGSIPTASWNASSTCNVTGVANTVPTGIGQTFGNFTWNCTGQTGNINFAPTSIAGNFSIISTNASQLRFNVATLTVSGNFSISGGTFVIDNNAGRTVTVGGNVTISGGTLDLNRGGGNTGTLNVAGNFSHTAGTITESGGGAGAIVFNGNTTQTYTSGGTVSNVVNFTVNNGATLQMAADATLLGNGSTGTFTLASGATLGVTSTVGITTTGATGSIRVTGTRTYSAGANYIYNGGANQVTGNGLTQNTPANLTINSTNTVTLSAATTLTGNLLITQGTLSTSGSNFNMIVGGNWTNNGGTFTPGTGTVTFNGTGGSVINGSATTQTFNNLIVNETAGQTLSVGGSTTTLNISGAFTQTTGNFTAPATMSITGNTIFSAGTFTAPTNLNLSGNFTNNGATFTAGSGTVSMNGSGFAIGGSATTTFNNLTINNAGGTTLGNSITINNLLTLSNGRLTINTNNLTLGVDALAIAGTLNASNMIVATSTGQVRKLINKNESYLFPIGDIAAVAEYSPITVSFSSGTYAGGAYYGTNVRNVKHPNNTTTTNFLNRYWSVTQSGVTSFVASVTGTYLTADITGSETGQAASRYTGSLWVKYGALGSNTLSATSLTSFGDFTGLNNTPIISATPTSLTTFTYPFNNGPSNILSFNVSGTDLVENVVITPSASFEVSATGGAGFTASPSVSLPPTGGSISSLPVYVRMKSGLTTGAVASQNQIVSTSGASSVNVACSGNVSNQPSITITPASSTLFSYTFALGPSAEQTFNVSASNLFSNVTITAPANYEISTVTGVGFTPSTPSIAPTSGSIALGTGAFTNVPIYVRLKSGLGTGSFIENVVASATYAASKTITCTGTVSPKATLTTSTSWLASFIYSGVGPSASQTFQLTGTTLTTDVTVTPPADFELSTNGTTWNTDAFTVPQTGGSLNQIMYARLRSGRTVKSYGPQNVTLAAFGATVKTVALNGSVVNSATILTSKPTLTGFGYLFGSGPSTEQFITVSGASLTNNITITPPANFEISAPSIPQYVNYQSTAITLTRVGTTIAATKINIRLKAGIAATNYTENLDIVSSGALPKTVALTGKVFATPLITSTGGGDYCTGSTINFTSSGADVLSQFWSGPNSFYASTANTSLTNATPAMSGDYTVTGNVVVGGNLIYNGDFELRNTGVGSSYTYVPLSANALQPEDLYTIVSFPRSVHTNFNRVADHSPAATDSLQMVINGYRTAGVVVWSQSVSVLNNADYEFTYYLQTVVNGTDPAPAKLQLYVNGVMAGPIYTANATSGIWTKYLYNTNAGSNSILNLELINQTTAANGNDFALDDIEFRQVLSATSTQTVNISDPVTASVTVNYSPTTVNLNTPVVFTATPTNGGLTPTYKWFVGGVEQVGQTSAEFTYTPLAAGALQVRCEMTSSIPCAAPKPAPDTKNITVVVPVNYWMGYIDTDWGKPANWTAGYVPATGDDVIYATVANFGTAAIRDLQLDKNRTIGSLINATIRRLLIPANLTLSCNNTISVTPPTTDPVTNAEDLVYIYASTSLPNGSIIYRNPQNLPAYGTVEMYSPASWDKTKPINQKYNWQFFGIPVASLAALPTFYGAYVRELFENSNDTALHWQSLTNESVLIPFKGYELCQQNANTLYSFKGQLVNSNFSSGQFIKTTTGNPLYPGQHLFANPYTAAIDIKLIDFGSGVEATAYLYATGTFVQWRSNKLNMTGAIPGQYFSVPKEQAGGFGIPRQIPSMGTLMVRVPKANATTEFSYVNFNYNNVAMGNSERQRVKTASTTDNQTTTVIEVEGENAADRMWLMSNEGFTRGFDNGFDGIKLKGSALNPQLYAVEKDGEYQVNSVDDLNNTTLAFQAGQDTEYKIKFTHSENTSLKYNKILLHDLIENRIVDITSNGSEYTFNATSASSSVLRFKIITQTNNSETLKSDVSKAYYFNNQLYVQNFSDISGRVYVYDISGRTVAIKSIPSNENIQIATPRSNVYIVKTVIGNSSETTKLFLK